MLTVVIYLRYEEGKKFEKKNHKRKMHVHQTLNAQKHQCQTLPFVKKKVYPEMKFKQMDKIFVYRASMRKAPENTHSQGYV